ncbi:amidohydrolase family protein [Amycolatopsis nigrescens]|uniref:amidohydrolase family protein n=1 Tax=Amycolatopsis nigrescens TaxID=381445 RepID=UPI00036B1F65|nr:amidohydrolase family protein [Amycolatopsis nigrescens]
MGEFDRRAFLAWLGSGVFGSGVFGATVLSGGRTAAAGLTGVTVLTHATVIDGTGAPPRPDTTVVLSGDRILAVGRPPETPAMAGVRVLDLTGRFVIPGLWDLHAHESTLERTFPPMHLVHGVTGIREMQGFPATHEVRSRIESGALDGPRMVIASNIIDGPNSRVPGSTRVTTPAEARAAVRQARLERADFVKVYSFFEREGYLAVAEEAKRQGIPFAGHNPSLFSVQEVADRGQHSIEHMYGLHLATSSRMPELYRQIAAMSGDPADPGWWGARVPFLEREAVATYSPRCARELAGRMLARGTWHVPTLAVESTFSRPPAQLPDDPRLRELMERYLPRPVREQWLAIARAWPPWSPERAAQERAYFEAKLELVGDLAAAGANLGTGTDSGYAFVFPGIALHDELELLVRAGLSPLRALQAATMDAARCAWQEPGAGTVTAGGRADLVVLDADPLADIRNSRRIHAVVAGGRYLGPPERRRIFAAIEQAAGEG